MGDEIHEHCPHCEMMRKQVSDIHGLLTGGSEPSRGIIVRMDRLEQAEKWRDWLTKAAIGVALSAVGAVVAGWVKSGGKP